MTFKIPLLPHFQYLRFLFLIILYPYTGSGWRFYFNIGICWIQ